MTKWTFKKKPKNNNILILKTEPDEPRALLGEATHIHAALTEMAPYFTPGDIVVTPEGSCIMKDMEGEVNN